MRALHFLRVCFLCLVLSSGLVAQQPAWQKADGIFGGTVNAVLALSDQEFYAATNAGLFHTTNAGVLWQQRSFKSATIYALAEQNGVLYAGLGYSDEDGSGGLFRSTDGGEIWQGTLKSEEVYAIDARDGRIIVGTASNGIFMSSDGSSWTNALKGDVYAVCSKGQLILAGGDTAVYRSTDGGSTWRKNPLSNRGACYALCFGPHEIYAGTENGLFISTDNGATWTSAGVKGQAVYALVSDSTHLYVGTDTSGVVVRSHQSGSLNPSDMGYVSVLSLALSPLNCVAGAWEVGAYLSYDRAQTFSDINNGLTAAPMVCFSRTSQYEYAAGDGVCYSTDGGRSWEWTSLYAEVRALRCTPDQIQAYCSDGMYSSVDGGDNWESILALEGEDITAFAESDGLLVCALKNKGVRTSSDSGNSWQTTSLGSGDAQALLVDRSVIYAAMSDGTLKRSSDRGSTWSSVLIDSTVPLSALIRVDNVLIIGTGGNDIYTNVIGSSQWDHHVLNSILENYLSAFDLRSKELFAATWGYGVYLSADSGLSWSAHNDGLDNPFVYNITHSDDALLCTTNGQGVFYIDYVPSTVFDVARSSSLLCAPQPARDVLNVFLDTEESTVATSRWLRVYTILGELLMERQLSTNDQRTQIDCSGFANGLYCLSVDGSSGRRCSTIHVVH